MKTHPIIKAAVLTLILSLATSCGIYTKYETPTNTAITKAYVEARGDAANDTTIFGNLQWETIFTDPTLVDYINRALNNNLTLKDARLNIEAAQAQLQGAKLAFFPSVALGPNGAGASYSGNAFSWSYSIPLTVSWEVDIFAKMLNNKRSAKVSVESAEIYAQAVRSQIISSVANTYYAIASVESQLALSRNTARLWQKSVQTMKDLFDAGRTNQAAVVQFDANYQSVLASITTLEVTRNQLDNTMSILLGTLPQHWYVSADATLTVPTMFVPGVPMYYLANRPDVNVAERGLATAFYATNSARAAFYPGLTITANGGFTNLLGSIIRNPGDWFVQLAGSLAAPLFSRGQNIARLKAAKVAQNQAMNKFEATVMSAAAEVSDALTTYEKAVERLGYLDAQVQDLEKSVEYTNDLLLYSNGTYLEVLTAQQSLLQAQMNRLTCQLTQVQAVINLYQAMGGGR
ncbi:MAG: TolC family protein [Muribaculaceae bacterium]|nr:TolC family protein [Muribaculaceae bacterium]